MRKAHLQYVDAGCPCRFKADIEMYQAQLEGIKACYDELLTYCVKTQADVNESAILLHQARKHHQDLLGEHECQESRMIKQKRAFELQRHGRELFAQHLVRSYKKRNASALVRITAGYGAAFRVELERRASRHFADECFRTEEELVEAEAQLRNAEKRWQKARYLGALVADISAFTEKSKLSLDKFLVDQNEMGLKRWDEILDYKKSKVASLGLKILICDACNGWRWNDPKEPLV